MWLRFSLSAHTEFTHSNSVQVGCSPGCLDEHTLLSLGQKRGVLGWRGTEFRGRYNKAEKSAESKDSQNSLGWKAP